MAWRLAKSLAVLRGQVNDMFPGRSKVSDGTIGDEKHASRSSDHNPWVKVGTMGVVTALDLTHDPAEGLDSERLAEALLASRDPRIKYIISNRKIASGADGPSPWLWRKYSGANPHSMHVHISVEDSKALFDDERLWKFHLDKPILTLPTKPIPPLLKKGSKGSHVVDLQRALNAAGHSLKVDGDFGPVTDRAVRMFQKARGLVADGKVGPYTWRALLA